MKFAFKLLDKLIQKPTKTNLMALNKLMALGIPFNAPHGYKIIELSEEKIRILLPNRKLNHNHLSGIHACAMATVGEYCAGVSLLRKFGISKYRLILSDLHVKYTYQGRTDLEGSCLMNQIDVTKIKEELLDQGKSLVKLATIITDKKNQEVAMVTTTWQLKSWEQVKTKS